MKKNYALVLLFVSFLNFAQSGAPASAYYSGFDWVQTGSALKTALATKITSTHTKILNYAEAENAIKIVDLDPTDNTNTFVFLLYGFSPNTCTYVSETQFGTSSNWNEHRTRHKEADVAGSDQCAWNREHLYAQSLGTPALGQIGAGADAHHLRACDVVRNANRGNSKYGTGSGNSGYNGVFWYPGDEWKGDVARILMYLYLRYPTQCKPTGIVGTGSTVANDTEMMSLLLQWNAEDPVSIYEDKRNSYLGNTANLLGQGNRNPFIDNPYLATLVWGGQPAENRWSFLSTSANLDLFVNTNIYPNPTSDNKINIESNITIDKIEVINVNGQLMQVIQKPVFNDNLYQIENLEKGFYFMKISSDNQTSTRKVIVN